MNIKLYSQQSAEEQIAPAYAKWQDFRIRLHLYLPALPLWTKGPLPATINFQNFFNIKQLFNLLCPEISKGRKFKERSHISHTFLALVAAFPAQVEISFDIILLSLAQYFSPRTPQQKCCDPLENYTIQLLFGTTKKLGNQNKKSCSVTLLIHRPQIKGQR